LPEEQEVDESARRIKTNMAAAANSSAADEDIENDDATSPEEGSQTNNEEGSQEQVFQLKSDFNVIKVTEDGYEGAIVLTPKPNIYFEPITVLDFASLYPSEMIASDLSHDRIVEDECWLGDEGIKRLDALGYDVLDRSYDNYSWVDPKNKNKGKYKNGVVTIRFVQTRDGSKGLMPRILQKLLTARKKKKKEMEAATDPFKKTILEGLQLAYKLTANSLYGQIGAQTSKIYKKAIAASTTAGGRINIYKARDFVLKNNPGCEVVYGDTDSVFVKLNLVFPDGTYPEGREAKIQRSIDIGLQLQQQLKDEGVFRKPHDLEYEKVYYPLILITKKRYIGIKYEFDPNDGKKTSMGVVTKRRDNAPILKHTFNGVVDTRSTAHMTSICS
jgi:DNA polymerase delta subunit 1